MEAQNKYERELMLHAADVEALQAAKEQVSKMASVRQHLEETAQKAESQLLACKASWEERERVVKVLLQITVECLGEMKISVDFWFSGFCFSIHLGNHNHGLLACRMKFPRVCLAVKI